MAKAPDKSSGAGSGPPPPAGGSAARFERRGESRSNVVQPVRCRYESVLDFVDTQSMNISRTGMFIMTENPPPVGTRVEFDFSLSDGFQLLAGTAEVMRVVTAGPINGMGIRFLDIDDAYRALIERIVAVNSEEGRSSTLNFDFSRPATAASMLVVRDPSAAHRAPVEPAPRPASAPVAAPAPSPAPAAQADPVVDPKPDLRPVRFEGRSLRLVLGPATLHHFTQNPLLNVRSGGLFLPAEEDVPLGTVFEVEILDGQGQRLVNGHGKVVAKQELRVGLRLTDADKDSLARLRAEVAKLEPKK